MNIVKILITFLLLNSLVYAQSEYKESQCIGTWEIDIKKSKHVNQNINSMILSMIDASFHFVEFKKNHVFTIYGLNENLKWSVDKNKVVVINKKGFTISGVVKSVNNKQMIVEFSNKKNETYSFVYAKTTPIKAKIKPLEEVIYEAKGENGRELFFMFSKNRYIFLSAKLKPKELLSFGAEQMYYPEKIYGDWHRSKGGYIVKGKKIYIFGMDGVEIIDMKDKYSFKYKNKFLFEKRDKRLKTYVDNNKIIFIKAVKDMDIESLKLFFKYGYKMTNVQKYKLLFYLTDRYVHKNDIYSIEESKREEFMNLVKLLHKHGMKVDVKRKIKKEIISKKGVRKYTEVQAPKKTLILELFYKEALLLVKLGAKVTNQDLYFLMSLSKRKKLDKKILNQFIDRYKISSKEKNLMFSAIEYGDLEIEKKIFDKGVNNLQVIDCCHDLDVVEYAYVFDKKNRYKFLEYALSKNLCSYPLKKIDKTLKYQQTKAKQKDEKLIKMFLKFKKDYKKCLK